MRTGCPPSGDVFMNRLQKPIVFSYSKLLCQVKSGTFLMQICSPIGNHQSAFQVASARSESTTGPLAEIPLYARISGIENDQAADRKLTSLVKFD